MAGYHLYDSISTINPRLYKHVLELLESDSTIHFQLETF